MEPDECIPAFTFDNFIEYGLDRHAITPAILELETLVPHSRHGTRPAQKCRVSIAQSALRCGSKVRLIGEQYRSGGEA